MLIASLREVIRTQSLEVDALKKKLAEKPFGGDENVSSNEFFCVSDVDQSYSVLATDIPETNRDFVISAP